MWNELELKIKIDIKCNPLKSRLEPFVGEGNKNADIFVVFDSITKSMSACKSIIPSDECKMLKTIFEFSKINFDDCFFTTLNRYYNPNIIEYEERNTCMKFLLEEIYLVKPKYIVVVGEEIFNFMYMYYTKKKKNKKYVDIVKNVGTVFDFYGIPLIPIYDMSYISKAKLEEKRKLVQVLKEIKK
ncbi:uracil-DNA glycosylase family protein [Caviibacter abscessus]|uniref:uracil-DNA glycosylase family protein n=1 Tax=Caviibacter abscessus TaxID=1766719 RepID=UPI00082C949A|nr:uracil-DNA glycosylase family protein [Caviibacter abscessus]